MNEIQQILTFLKIFEACMVISAAFGAWLFIHAIILKIKKQEQKMTSVEQVEQLIQENKDLREQVRSWHDAALNLATAARKTEDDNKKTIAELTLKITKAQKIIQEYRDRERAAAQIAK